MSYETVWPPLGYNITGMIPLKPDFFDSEETSVAVRWEELDVDIKNKLLNVNLNFLSVEGVDVSVTTILLKHDEKLAIGFVRFELELSFINPLEEEVEISNGIPEDAADIKQLIISTLDNDFIVQESIEITVKLDNG